MEGNQRRALSFALRVEDDALLFRDLYQLVKLLGSVLDWKLSTGPQ